VTVRESWRLRLSALLAGFTVSTFLSYWRDLADRAAFCGVTNFIMLFFNNSYYCLTSGTIAGRAPGIDSRLEGDTVEAASFVRASRAGTYGPPYLNVIPRLCKNPFYTVIIIIFRTASLKCLLRKNHLVSLSSNHQFVVA